MGVRNIELLIQDLDEEIDNFDDVIRVARGEGRRSVDDGDYPRRRHAVSDSYDELDFG
jgi:hypothetical protein